MTGYATGDGNRDGTSWTWEIRGVNARGLDLRMRLPDGLGGLEAPLRKAVSAQVTRGAISLNLRLARDDTGAAFRINGPMLTAALQALRDVANAAVRNDVALAPPRATELLAMRGVMDATDAPDVPAPDVFLADFDAVLGAFADMRRTEGAALADVLTRQLDQIARLVAQAETAAAARSETHADRFRTNVAGLIGAADMADPARLAQELAMLAVKSDVTEELDRLRAHVDAARALLAAGGPVGRKLDFLMQEFNREANTLCSKSGDTALTAAGLDLKLTIDQMREQVQNLE
jgi:uncharacterized protein (TIGR00255 family)